MRTNALRFFVLQLYCRLRNRICKHFNWKRSFLQDPKETPPPVRVETREERLERRRRERAEQVAYKLEQEIAVWDPAGISNVTADPFKTLFVARIVTKYIYI